MNYWKSASDHKWRRSITLDRECEDQRHEQLWQNNRSYKGRKISITTTFDYFREQGLSVADAYERAWRTQLFGMKSGSIKRSGLNIDARETLFVEEDLT